MERDLGRRPVVVVAVVLVVVMVVVVVGGVVGVGVGVVVLVLVLMLVLVCPPFSCIATTQPPKYNHWRLARVVERS
jgi:ABC-type transport system involved in cytochrome bd biosynthesis fused ATPase/permease subunit